MHFIRLGFNPVKKTFDSIPVAIFPSVLRVIAFTVEQPLTFVVLEVPVGSIDINTGAAGGMQQVSLAFRSTRAGEGGDTSLLDAQRWIRDGFAQINAYSAAKAAAFRARSEGGVK